MASENRDWGYDRIAGALANLGYQISDQTVGNVLRRHSLPPAPERKRTTTWAAFVRTHLALLAGTDFFTVGEMIKLAAVDHDIGGGRARSRFLLPGRPYSPRRLTCTPRGSFGPAVTVLPAPPNPPPWSFPSLAGTPPARVPCIPP